MPNGTDAHEEADLVLVGPSPLATLIQESLDLPFKTVAVSDRGSIITEGMVDPEHINALADVKIEEDKPVVHIKFSAWRNSGGAASLDRQLFIGGSTTKCSKKQLFVFDPYDVRIWAIDDEVLQSLVSGPDGYFWQVARFFGHDRLCSRFQRNIEETELQINYGGLIRFDEPIRRGFGINKEADLYVGDLVFEVSLA